MGKSINYSWNYNLHFNLDEEPNSIKKQFKGVESVIIDIKLKNTVFEPVDESHDMIYFYGYLNQILEYKMYVDGVEYSS